MNHSDHWAKYVKSFRRIEDYTFANNFLRLSDTSFPKKRKKSRFYKSDKTVKYAFSNTARTWHCAPKNPDGHWQSYVTDDVLRQVPPLLQAPGS